MTDPTAPAGEPPLSKKAQERLARLQDRLNVLDCRIESGRAQKLDQERAEASALAWAIERIRTDTARIEELSRALEAERERHRWIPVDERLPDACVPVLAFYRNELGKTRRIRAFYAPPKTIEDNNEYDAAEYDEEGDEYFLREGWYENNEHDEVNWWVDEPVTHWMPLPAPPEEKP